MNDLLKLTIDAHGGLDTWNKFKTISAKANISGLTWLRKGQPDILKDVSVFVNTKKQAVSYKNIKEGWHTVFEPNYIVSAITDEDLIIEELSNPRQSFAGHTIESTWTKLQAFYFASYAIWTYFNAPFNFANPDYEVTEIEPWQENGEQWRRLQVTFPKSVETHNPTQTFYIDKTGLIRRHDYNVEIVANATSCHYLDNYIEVQGIKIAAKRRVYVRKQDNTPLTPEPLLVSINIDEVGFHE